MQDDRGIIQNRENFESQIVLPTEKDRYRHVVNFVDDFSG